MTIIISDKADFKTRSITRGEEYSTIIKISIRQEDRTILN